METTENVGQSGAEPSVGSGDGPDGEAGALANGAGEAAAAGGDGLAPVTPPEPAAPPTSAPAQRGRPPKTAQSKQKQPESGAGPHEPDGEAGALAEHFPNAVLLDVDPRPMRPDINPSLDTFPDLSWHEFAEHVQAIEASEPDRRLVRVWHLEPKAQVLNGVYAGAEVLTGNMAYQWSDGEIVKL